MTVFDLIKVTELRDQLNRSEGESWDQLFQQIRLFCDCEFPDGSSTCKEDFFGHMCIFCGRNDY